ncbi:MAG: hypothetical protein M1827_005087 [Pycnora praestabilis]|nr:MAG: hypothetical protein M1827_005087 [Pycnora praestabilis]
MGDSSDSKKTSIPQWQRQNAAPASDKSSPSSGAKESTEEESPPSRVSLVDQASKFLQDDEIRDAPTERKIAFLESKGLTNDEVQTVLGVSRNLDAATESLSTRTPGRTTSSQNPSSQQTQPALTSQQPPAPQAQALLQPRDIPPIVTYPEFLTQSHKPPPLITARRLLYTLYIAGGTAASIYGLSKFIVAPMTNSLASSRHELAETAQSNLETLNTRLESMVSQLPTVPHSKVQHIRTSDEAEENDLDASSEDSDPTELFHRDFGTQTSPALSRRSSTSATSTTPATPDMHPITSGHTNRLKIMHSHLSEMLSDDSAVGDNSDEIATRIADLTTYLDGLTYSSPSYYGGGSYGPIGSAGLGGVGTVAGVNDMVKKVKDEIRGVKGVFLSARNFPASAGRPVARVEA